MHETHVRSSPMPMRARQVPAPERRADASSGLEALQRQADGSPVIRPLLVLQRKARDSATGDMDPETRAAVRATAMNMVGLVPGAIGPAPYTPGAAPVQRDVASAALALRQQGVFEVKKNQLKGKFARDHGISANDLAAIQAEVTRLREAAPQAEVAEVVDMTDNSNWPTGRSGMVEGDAETVAGVNGWWETSNAFRCTGHNPNGKVYTDGKQFFGADNTGHSGWGFKVWLNGKKPTIKTYAGNYNWNGANWVHDDRGTGEQMK